MSLKEKKFNCTCGRRIEMKDIESFCCDGSEGDQTSIEFECPKCPMKVYLWEWGEVEEDDIIELVFNNL